VTAYTAICEREDGWWVVTVPELDSGRVTQARTLDKVPDTVADLVRTMTGASPDSVEVRATAGKGPGRRR
jgi:predicted RNase H-like HicB family nuclease